MLQRCYNKKLEGYQYWGRRESESVQWRGPGGFIQFVADMGRRRNGMTLDRKNPEGHY